MFMRIIWDCNCYLCLISSFDHLGESEDMFLHTQNLKAEFLKSET